MEWQMPSFSEQKEDTVTIIKESKGTMDVDSVIRKGLWGRSYGHGKYDKKIKWKTSFKFDY